jgi:hypothetical protein
MRTDVTWAVSLLDGRGNFGDLQVQGLALASSIIINEPVVPKILIVWDTPNDGTTLSHFPERKCKQYPWYLLRAFNPKIDEEALKKEVFGSHFYFSNKYVDLHRSWLSVNPHQYSLGLGYKAKYLGLNYVTTKYGISGDIDTICRKPTVDRLMKSVYESPDTFCFTGWHNEHYVMVGLCVYNMEKYRNYFLPNLSQNMWKIPKQDSMFIKTLLKMRPDLNSVLDIKTFGDVHLHAEKFYLCKARGNSWDEERTLNWHSFKYEPAKDPVGYFKLYNEILDNLANSAKQQLGVK